MTESQQAPPRTQRTTNALGEHRHNTAVRKLRNALRRLAQAGLDHRVTLSVKLNGDDVSVYVNSIPISEPGDLD